jgi:hypothetical protein
MIGDTASVNEIKIGVIRKHKFKNDIILSKTMPRTTMNLTVKPSATQVGSPPIT